MEDEQIPKICEFCEASREIKMKCINCNLFLCRACHLKIHSKIKAANDHIGIGIQDYCTESIFKYTRKVNLKQISCLKHNDKTCFLFCRDCEQLICSTCVIKSHKRHKFEEIDLAYHKKMHQLEHESEQIDSEIPNVEIQETKLREMKLEGENNIKEIKYKIFQHEYKIKDDISIEAKTLLKQADNRWELTKDSIIKQRKRIQKSREDLEKRKAQLNLVLHSRRASEIFVTAKEVKPLLLNTCFSYVQIETLLFSPRKCDLEDIGVYHKKERFAFVCAIQTNLHDISRMLEIDEKKYVLYSSVEKKLQLVQFISNAINIQKEIIDIVVSDIAVSKDSRILLLIKSDLYCLTDTGKLKKLELGTAYEDLDSVQCIHLNNENQIVVGSKFDNDYYFEEERYYGMIMSFDSVDHFCNRTQEEFEEEPLFNKILYSFLPDRIISTNDNDYCLIVRETLFESKQISRFNHEFESKWIYDGCCKHTFYPIDIAESPAELICVVDNYKGGVIHVLNRDGNVLTCNLLSNEDVACPISVHITVSGMIFIGSEKNKKNQQAHIYLFKLK
ncbi:Hypothetical predicted protein [Mytilus galloprovincialis]|uniref:B box-type domain-containing protein n=1 Tax=Mytilus galloprovincialis TaxID=29158 RepID=A0A8B6C5D3_MYTGA|nr:Hypothetical predicted protein [Mytilus galloprovincialis]